MPAAAVIPAPIAYIKVVAVKKLVVGFLIGSSIQVRKDLCVTQPVILRGTVHWHSVVGVGTPVVYCEQIRVFKARCS